MRTLFLILLFVINPCWGQDIQKMPDISSDDLRRMQLLSSKSITAVAPGNKPSVQTNPARSELNMPRINTERVAPIDIEALARRYEKDMQKAIAPSNPSDFIIFVSLGMRKETLRQLSEQANRFGAVIVLRGLKNNSLKETIKEIRTVIGSNKVGWQINPVAFTRFNVSTVPTFVIAKGNEVSQQDTKGCAPPSSYISVAGDVSADYALEKLADAAPKEFEQLVSSFIKKGTK